MTGSVCGPSKRLDGWKAVAAYYNRDRTTVMRWARERNLPVYRVPGGKQGSVFAFEHELMAWALPAEVSESEGTAQRGEGRAESANEQPVQPIPAPKSDLRQKSRKWRTIRAAVAALGLLLIGLGVGRWAVQDRLDRSAAQARLLPHDDQVARDYILARDRWALRTPKDLEAAIRLYESVIRRDPGFAPAYVGLADAWLVIREYGDVNEPAAYRRARAHAEAALRLDPGLPGAHRALGFIEYWWDGRPDAAIARFRRAITLNDHDSQTHFWFANVLADVGYDQEAQREYDRARLLSPGSRVIEVEQACSHWQAGRDRQALTALTELARRAPDDATIHNCLAWVHISRGDIASYAQALSNRARLRGEPELLRFSRHLNDVVQRDPGSAVVILVTEGRRELATGTRKLRETPAFYASALGDRAALLKLLTEANDLGEQWPSFPVTSRIAARWRGDTEVQRLLAGVVLERSLQKI